jgi:hypothetical protein
MPPPAAGKSASGPSFYFALNLLGFFAVVRFAKMAGQIVLNGEW